MKTLLPILLLLAFPAHADDGGAICAVLSAVTTAMAGTSTSPDGGGDDE